MLSIFKKRVVSQDLEITKRANALVDDVIDEMRAAIAKHDAWALDHLERAKAKLAQAEPLSEMAFSAQRDVNRFERMIAASK